MHTVSLVNPNFQQGPVEINAYYLPYSVGTLWAYAHQFTDVASQFKLNRFVWRRDNVKTLAQQLAHDAVVGFSVYVWNNLYSQALAKEIKRLNPDVLIVFGGPEPPIEDPDFFKRFPFVDICVKTEGEISFRSILQNYGGDYKRIPGLLINCDQEVHDTGPAQRILDLSELPSPYLNGYFDRLLEEHPEVNWNGTLETNRGCPYACTFCDWGSLTYNKIKKFDIERVYAELEWFGKNNIEFISITDANFGVFPDRDMAIADKLVEVQQEYNAPRSYTISWAKNQKQEVIDIVKKLMFEGGTTLGLNLSVQTLDDNTLEIIKRKNMAMNRVQEVFDECEVNSIPLYTELILGLPGETPETWRNNFWTLYESGNHTGITVYQAQLLENAEMNLTQRNLYCLESQAAYDYLPNQEEDSEMHESVDIITSTIDLPREKMLDAQVFSWFQTTFHINGFTNYAARFMHKYLGESYKNFYEKFYEYVQNDEWVRSETIHIRNQFNVWMETGRIDNSSIQGINIYGWNLMQSTVIKIHSQQCADHINQLLRGFLMHTYPELSGGLLESVLALQSNYVIDYGSLQCYPRDLHLEYDILGYIQGTNALESPVTYNVDFPENKDISLRTFCEQIFFARRKNFGKSWITKKA